VEGASPTIARASTVGALSMATLAGAVIILILLKPKVPTKALAAIVMIAAMGYLGAFEWSREAARRPYVINEVMYSNGILKKEVERINKEGFLKNAKWVQNKEITEANRLDAGRELFVHQCYACHTQGGFNNDIIARTGAMSYGAMRKYLATLHEKRYFMPPFVGNEEELKALAAYLTAGLHNKPLTEDAAPPVGGGGQALFEDNCVSCHGMDVLKPLMAGWNRPKIRSSLDKLSALNPGMPDYEGSPAEKELMTDYLLKETGGAK
jgi:mono/diheme cytochrome c family protein